MTELHRLDACAQADLVRRGEVAPAELVESAIRRIEALDGVVHAVVTPLFDRALAEAGSPRLPEGPFRGVPILLKDYLCEVAGTPYFEGMGLLRDLGWRSRADSPLAGRFREAGFVVVGKTSLPELAASPRTEPAAFGPTRNPWSRDRSPGGSSGGSAAAVAAGMVPLAHGNDGTGSLRIPASCCGLVGLKPSRGRVPVGPDGDAGPLGHVAEHVLTRCVRDTAAVLDAVAGELPGAPFQAPAPARPFRDEVGADPGRLRVGFLESDPLLDGLRAAGREIAPAHPECVAAVRRTAALLERLGHAVEESHPPALHGPTGLGGARGVLAASGLAARLDAWGARIGRPVGREEVEPATWEAAERGRRYTAVDVHRALQRLTAGVRPVALWWEDGFDLLLTPTLNRLPPPIEDPDLDPADGEGRMWRDTEDFGLYTVPYSFTGQPSVSLPVHRAGDLPVGVQLVARWARDDLLIRVAAQLEEALGWAGAWPEEAGGR